MLARQNAKSRSAATRASVVILVVLIASIASPTIAQVEKPTCYKFVKADLMGDHLKDEKSVSQDEAVWFTDNHTVSVEADGTYVIKKKDRPTFNWRVNIKTGHAVGTETSPPGTVEINWTVPPDTFWCSNQDVRLSLSAKAVGEIFGITQFYQRAAERWDESPGTKVEGSNPFGNLPVGRFSNGYGASASGSISLRPKFKGGDEQIAMMVRLGSNDDIAVHYHYQRTDEPVPPTLPPVKPPTKPEGCAKTFGKEWLDGSWGHWAIHVTGSKAAGEYTNRSGKFGAGTIVGTITGNVLEGTWKDANGHGTVKMILSDDGCSFTGTHTIAPGTDPIDGPGGLGHPGGHDLPGGDGGGGTGGGGAGAFPAEPCLDPDAQKCIDEWMRLAEKIRNKLDTRNSAPNGPWRINEYGVWVGHGVKSGGKHDNWVTVYHSNKYCYVWMEYQQEHTVKSVYHDELPPLKAFVEDCHAKSHPPGGSGGGGGGGTDTGIPKPPATGHMTLQAMKRKVATGETVQVPVWLWKGADIANMNVTVTFSGAVATTAGDPTAGYLLADALFTANAREDGVVKLAFSRGSGISGDGPVAYLSFRATGKPGDKTPITLSVTTINTAAGSVPAIDTIPGEILVTGTGGELPGDGDGDGVVTTADAWEALQMSVGNLPVKMALDMNKDAAVTSRDATLILQQRVNR